MYFLYSPFISVDERRRLTLYLNKCEPSGSAENDFPLHFLPLLVNKQRKSDFYDNGIVFWRHQYKIRVPFRNADCYKNNTCKKWNACLYLLGNITLSTYCVRREGWRCWCHLCKYVTWSVGCFGVGEAARGEQLIANQGQEWMGIRTTSKRSRISK
jgi:hypothetical protein